VKAWLFVLSATLAVWTSSSPPPDALEIYAIDVEGGKATLVVAPSRESLLIDTGNAGEGARRDAERIMAAVRDAGLQQIDHLVTTHWHRDHFGGMAARPLAQRAVTSRVTRRFRARPASVELSAIGLLSPNPWACTRSAGAAAFFSASATASARAVDSSRLTAALP
jgi:glyoxylase-like metal-dependent hydrolase (beta-lactamase superfamily II)